MKGDHPPACPKCHRDLVPARTRWESPWCPACRAFVCSCECVACGATYFSLRDTGGGRHGSDWHDHQCDPKKIKRLEAARKGVKNRTPAEPSEGQRLTRGGRVMEQDEGGCHD